MKYTQFWNSPWALSLTSAILLSLSYPPFDLAILQIPAFILLFRIGFLSDTVREYILYAYPSLVLWNLFVTYWLMMATVAGGIAAILANALIMMIPLIFARKLFQSSINPLLASFFAASLWVSYEFLHHNWDLAWPWLTLGNGWSNLTGAIQYISITGVYAISFWITATAALLFLYLEKGTQNLLYSATFIFFLFPIFSVIAMTYNPQGEGEPIEVAIVQPNSDSYQEFGGLSSLDELVNKLLSMTGDIVTEHTDVVIWPENAIASAVPISNRYFEQIQDSLDTWNTTLITGTGLVDYYSQSEPPAVVRESTFGRTYNVYNAAIHFDPNQSHHIYKKGKLVPIVERFPFVEFFQRIDLFNWVEWGNLVGYGLGMESNNFFVNGEKTPALICYDSVFPGWVNRFVRDGAGFITIITNDGWWGDSSGHIQHFAYARLRAIEHRRWIARSANNGISGIISPDGRVKVETEYWTEDSFTFTIYSYEEQTLYARYGEWFGFLMLLLSGIGLVHYRVSKGKGKQDNSP